MAQPGTMLRLPPRTGFDDLSDDDYAKAAQMLGCEVLAIKAVALQEGKGKGFDEFNRPVILYEPNKFLHSQDRSLKPRERKPYDRVFSTDYPILTKLKPRPHPYGPPSANWRYLQWSYLIDPKSALRVVSWGEFQILGSNAGAAGFRTTEAFVTAMCHSLQDQLRGFVSFLQTTGAQSALAKKDWAGFAASYNGPNYAAGFYDTKLAAKYDQLVAASK